MNAAQPGAGHNRLAAIDPEKLLAVDLTEGVFYDEDELVDAYARNGVIQLGWVHTHPSQDAFLSSVDLHTHLGYQQLLPESVAVVVAPRCNNAFAVFRLTDGEACAAGRAPVSGIDVIAACDERGFHASHVGVEGTEGVVYERSCHVFVDPDIELTVVDLR